MDKSLPVLPPFVTPLPPPTIASSAGENGFYTDTPQLPPTTTNADSSDLVDITPDKKYLIIGCTLGVVMLVLLIIGSVFAIKLYKRKRAKQVIKQKADEENMMEIADDDEALGGSRHLSPPPSYTSQSGSSKKLQLSSILDPGSQFSLAVQRASEIPDSPTSPAT